MEGGAGVKTDGGGDEADSYGDSGATAMAILTRIQATMTIAWVVLSWRSESNKPTVAVMVVRSLASCTPDCHRDSHEPEPEPQSEPSQHRLPPRQNLINFFIGCCSSKDATHQELPPETLHSAPTTP
ncbi:hypothetical protein E2C01_025320 [Portunus trituberculatus]|uniref:Uncharacterized protein n=1 Tax=Portunus trituberculatus TaxID=210409 RepID=A0A5B7EFG7_PORTR|nr:hypothetical protein [Portunus trituberculatus]